MRSFQLGTLALFTAAAIAQTPAREVGTFTLVHAANPPAINELAAVLRIVTLAPDVTVDETARTVSCFSTAAELNLAGWLVKQLDVSAETSANPAEYPGAASSADDTAVRIFYPGIRSVQQLQNSVNLIRAIADVQRIAPYFSRGAVIARGTPAQIETLTWLLNTIGGSSREPAATTYRDPRSQESQPVRVVFLEGGAQVLQQTVNLLRTITDIQRIFPYEGSGALVWRANAAQDQLAGWLFSELRDPGSSREYQIAGARDSLVRVLQLPSRPTKQETEEVVNRLRAATGAQRLYAHATFKALAIRGTPAQVAQAEQLLKQ